jgi:hypothetical protein
MLLYGHPTFSSLIKSPPTFLIQLFKSPPISHSSIKIHLSFKLCIFNTEDINNEDQLKVYPIFRYVSSNTI